MKQHYTTEIKSEAPGEYHIPGVGNTQQTLCGFVDCVGQEDHHYTDHPVNCLECISMYNQIKNMKLPKGYLP